MYEPAVNWVAVKRNFADMEWAPDMCSDASEGMEVKVIVWSTDQCFSQEWWDEEEIAADEHGYTLSTHEDDPACILIYEYREVVGEEVA